MELRLEPVSFRELQVEFEIEVNREGNFDTHFNAWV